MIGRPCPWIEDDCLTACNDCPEWCSHDRADKDADAMVGEEPTPYAVLAAAYGLVCRDFALAGLLCGMRDDEAPLHAIVRMVEAAKLRAVLAEDGR